MSDTLDKAHKIYYNMFTNADMAQLVERVLGKDEVTGSTPVISSKKTPKLGFEFRSFFIRFFQLLLYPLLKEINVYPAHN